MELSPPLRNALHFLRVIPSIPCSRVSGRPYLPPQKDNPPRPTLVLDLDETLVHCTRIESLKAVSQRPGTELVVQFDDLPTYGGVLFRPFVNFFLKACAQHFELVVFTASQKSYADKVINALDPSGTYISHRLYREHCTEHRGAFFKELALIGRPVSKCILVDNSPIAVACNGDQGIVVRSWYGDRSDQELMQLLTVLQECLVKGGGDFGRYLAGRFGLRDFFQALRSGSGAAETSR